MNQWTLSGVDFVSIYRAGLPNHVSNESLDELENDIPPEESSLKSTWARSSTPYLSFILKKSRLSSSNIWLRALEAGVNGISIVSVILIANMCC